MKKLRRELHLMQQQVDLQQQQQQPGGGEAAIGAGLETGPEGSKATLAALQVAGASQASHGTDRS